LELAGGAPAVAVVAGCAVLVVTCIGLGTLPAWVSIVAQLGAMIAVLSRVVTWTRFEPPWPLYTLSLLIAVVIALTLLEPTQPRRWSIVVGSAAVVASAAVLSYKTGHRGFVLGGQSGPEWAAFAEHRPLIFAVPAMVAALVAAALLTGSRPVWAGATVAVALGALLWMVAPMPNLGLVAGFGLGGAVLAVLAGFVTGRIRATPPRADHPETSAAS
jgi:hypothetical protein